MVALGPHSKGKQNSDMRYERITDIVDLAVRLQASYTGLTMDQIADEFRISRRTAERRRAAVDQAFGPLERRECFGDRRLRWRLRSTKLAGLLGVAPQTLAELELSAETLARAGAAERAARVRECARKMRALQRHGSCSPDRDCDLELILDTERPAMQPVPAPRLEPGLLDHLREAVRRGRVVDFAYRSPGKGETRRSVRPYGIVHGARSYLVGPTAGPPARDPRLWRLDRLGDPVLTDEVFEADPDFDLRRYAERSFGIFQEEPFEVVLRFAPEAAAEAATWRFHPTQALARNEDGALTVRFTAGGETEICRHLFTWGESVTVERPARLRRRLAEMCSRLAARHGPGGSA